MSASKAPTPAKGNVDDVEVTFIQNAENDIDGGNRRGDQDRLVAEGLLKDLGSTGEYLLQVLRQRVVPLLTDLEMKRVD